MADVTGFFYGTLMAIPILYRVIYGTTSPEAWQVASLRIRPAILHSFCRYKVRFVDYPGIIPADGKEVRGTYVEGLTEDGKEVRGTYVEGLTEGDVFRLDRFEGKDYCRKMVKVKLLEKNGEEGEDVETETYIWIAGEDKLEMEEWDFNKFIKTKLARWADSAIEYAEVDEIDPTERAHQPNDSEKEVNIEEIRSAV